jgi:hypothetical protein
MVRVWCYSWNRPTGLLTTSTLKLSDSFNPRPRQSVMCGAIFRTSKRERRYQRSRDPVASHPNSKPKGSAHLDAPYLDKFYTTGCRMEVLDTAFENKVEPCIGEYCSHCSDRNKVEGAILKEQLINNAQAPSTSTRSNAPVSPTASPPHYLQWHYPPAQ